MTTELTVYQDTEVNLGSMFSYISHALTESSIAMYKHAFKNYLAFASEQNLAPTESRTLEVYRDSLIMQTTKSPNTINRELASIKRLAKEAARHNLISRDAAYDFANVEGAALNKLKHRMKHTKSIPLSKSQMQQLCNVPDTSTLLGLRDKAILYTLATSGVRASELADLRVDRLFRTDEGFILQIMGKRDSEYRDANLAPDAYECIVQWLKNRGVVSPYVFTSFIDYGAVPVEHKMTARDVWNQVKQYAKQIEGMEYISPHSFRRYFATQIVKSEGIRTAQISLGHASIATTQMYDNAKLTVGVSDHLL